MHRAWWRLSRLPGSESSGHVVSIVVSIREGAGDASRSPANTEPVDQLLVPVWVDGFDVIEQAAPLAHQLEQAPPRMVILGVGLEVIGEIGNPLGQDRDLDFRRPGIAGYTPNRLPTRSCFAGTTAC